MYTYKSYIMICICTNSDFIFKTTYFYLTIRPSQVNRLHKMHLQTKREARLIRSDIGLKFVDTDYECSSDSDMDEMLNREIGHR